MRLRILLLVGLVLTVLLFRVGTAPQLLPASTLPAEGASPSPAVPAESRPLLERTSLLPPEVAVRRAVMRARGRFPLRCVLPERVRCDLPLLHQTGELIRFPEASGEMACWGGGHEKTWILRWDENGCTLGPGEPYRELRVVVTPEPASVWIDVGWSGIPSMDGDTTFRVPPARQIRVQAERMDPERRRWGHGVARSAEVVVDRHTDLVVLELRPPEESAWTMLDAPPLAPVGHRALADALWRSAMEDPDVELEARGVLLVEAVQAESRWLVHQWSTEL